MAETKTLLSRRKVLAPGSDLVIYLLPDGLGQLLDGDVPELLLESAGHLFDVYFLECDLAFPVAGEEELGSARDSVLVPYPLGYYYPA